MQIFKNTITVIMILSHSSIFTTKFSELRNTYTMYLLSGVLFLELILSVASGYSVHDRIQQNKADAIDSKGFSDHNGEQHTEQNHVPQFMLNLYKHLSGKRWSPRFDTARSYSQIATDIYRKDDALLSNQYTTRYQIAEIRTILFNISHFPANEHVELAQLRLFVQPQNNRNYYEHDGSSKLTLHTFAANGSKDIIHPSRFIDVHGGYYEAFNVTQEVVQWLMKKSIKEQRFEIHMTRSRVWKQFKNNPISYKGDNAPQILILSRILSILGDDEERPLVRMRRSLDNKLQSFKFVEAKSTQKSTVFEDTELKKSEWSHLIVKRSEDEDLEELEEQSNYIVDDPNKVKKGKSKRRRNPCRRKPLHINFAAINYDQWIIAPPSYEAFECTGKCTFPMGAHLSPTKHAIIQTLMHSLQPKLVTRACCVPTKLDPISVLYVDDDGTVTYKYEYENMVVSECGCR